MDDSWVKQLDNAINARFEQMVQIRRHLHAHPEPSGAEHETSLYLYQLLSSESLKIELGPEGCGVLAQTKAVGENRCIALRADIDALRIHDRKNVDYKSQHDGLMHACGHDAHTATLMGAMLGLLDVEKANKKLWPLKWRAIFQPAEETCKGASAMVKHGALDNVDAILASHVDPTRYVGQIGWRKGILTANCDAMKITICGRGGHAARPHETIDPIAIAAQLISSIYQFIPRRTDSQESVVVTFGQITGGDNPNVIPEQVELFGTLRTLDEKVRASTIDHLVQLTRGLGQASSANIELEMLEGIGSVRNDAQLTDLLCNAAENVVGTENLQRIPRASMGSEDFAAYLEHVPGAMFRLGCSSEAVEPTSLHSGNFDIDENAMLVGAKIFARCVINWSNPDQAC